MSGVVFLVVVGVVGVVIAAVARLTWRQGGDERSSVRDYRQTLDTLRTMSGNEPPKSSVRPPDSRIRPSISLPAPASGLVRPVAAPVPRPRTGPQPDRADEHPDGSTVPAPADLVFDDAVGGLTAHSPGQGDVTVAISDLDSPPGRVPILAPSRPLGPGLGRPPLGRPGSGRPGPVPRRVRAAVTLTVAVLVLGGAVAGAVLLTGGTTTPRAGGTSSTSVSVSTTRPHTQTTVPASTTTTVPAVFQPVANGTAAATVTTPGASYTVVVSVTRSCWIEARTVPTTGPATVLSAGSAQPGVPVTIAGTGTVAVQIGSSGASLTLNGVPVALGDAYPAPFVLTFQPNTA